MLFANNNTLTVASHIFVKLLVAYLYRARSTRTSTFDLKSVCVPTRTIGTFDMYFRISGSHLSRTLQREVGRTTLKQRSMTSVPG